MVNYLYQRALSKSCFTPLDLWPWIEINTGCREYSYCPPQLEDFENGLLGNMNFPRLLRQSTEETFPLARCPTIRPDPDTSQQGVPVRRCLANGRVHHGRHLDVRDAGRHGRHICQRQRLAHGQQVGSENAVAFTTRIRWARSRSRDTAPIVQTVLLPWYTQEASNMNYAKGLSNKG